MSSFKRILTPKSNCGIGSVRTDTRNLDFILIGTHINPRNKDNDWIKFLETLILINLRYKESILIGYIDANIKNSHNTIGINTLPNLNN